MGHVDGPHVILKRQQSAPFRIEKSLASNSAAQGGSASWAVAELVVVAEEEGRGAAACGSRTSFRSGPSTEEEGSPVASLQSATKS
jgi:hypothetical protein